MLSKWPHKKILHVVTLGVIAILMIGRLGVLTAGAPRDVPGAAPSSALASPMTLTAEEEGLKTMASSRDYYGNIRAPEFPAEAQWLNTGRPLSLAELRGKLVLLDFWTYGCINCMHIIPDLKRLEAEHPEELVVIGVHSSKFANERDLENVRQIILRYDLEHPVVNDPDLSIWSAYAVRAWPTTILVDPAGRVIAAHSGEGVYAAYGELIAQAVLEYSRQGQIDITPLDLTTERSQTPDTALSFPGKVLADEAGGRLFIADSNHHRIVIADRRGAVLDVIGSGARGLVDGAYESAALATPQGMALSGDTLYIADTENHAIRAVDLEQRAVRTLAGDGAMGYVRAMAPASQAQLNSPWDLTLVDGVLFIAMAGLHQLWAYNLSSNTLGPHAGTGRESLLDGPLLRAALAQPSGLTSDGAMLYFADSEASAIRRADLSAAGQVRTIVGEGLFDFGDVDGVWPQARLQHPLGIAYHRGRLYVADTYNHKIKVVDVEESRVTTLAGSDSPGWRDGPDAAFYEPGGLSYADGRLYVADTNNHVVRTIDLDTSDVATLALQDPNGLLINLGGQGTSKRLRLPEQHVRAGQGMLQLNIALPARFKLNADAPSRVIWSGQGQQIRLAGGLEEIDLRGRRFPLNVEATYSAGLAAVVADLAIYYCESDNSVCMIDTVTVEIPLRVSDGAVSQQMVIDLPVPFPG